MDVHVQAALRAALVGAASLVGLVASPRPANAEGGWPPPVERYPLGNGLSVVLAPDDSLPDVSLQVTYDAGSADDPDGLEGLANLVVHVAFDGSRDVGPGDHAHLLALASATGVNGSTSVDATSYRETVAPGGLERALWLEANRMGTLRDFVQEAIVERERTIAGHEYHARVADSVFGTLAAFGWDEIYPAWHPFHVPSDGMSSIDRARVDDVRAFVRTWYAPSNATLSLAGHFDPSTAKALVEKYFGRLPAGATPRRPALPDLPAPNNLWIEVEAPVRPDFAEMYWATPPLGEPADHALDVAARLLTGPEGLLTKKFVEGAGPASSVRARESSTRRGSTFSVEVVPADGMGLSPLLLAVQAQMASFTSRLTPADVEAAKQWLRHQRLLNLEGSKVRASVLAYEGSWGLDRYDAIDLPAVVAAVQRYLDPYRRVTMVVRESNTPLPPGVLGVETNRERMGPR